MTAATGSPDGSGRKTTDGRRLRRDRNRDAVVRAVVDLFVESTGFPGLQEVADRSGVSLRSVHRYFEDPEDIVRAGLELFVREHADIIHFDDMPPASTPTAARIAWFVDHRLREHPVTSRGVINIAARAARDRGLAVATEAGRRKVIDAIRTLFAPELERLPADVAARTVATVHTTTIAEVWENMTGRHGLTAEQVRRLWLAQVAAALGGGTRP